jgi:glutamyl-tRNA synthetase
MGCDCLVTVRLDRLSTNFAVMLATLTIPAKQSPFPYAAAAIAAYTGKANIDIEGSASAINLEINGSSFNEEESIVQILAKESGLSEDSEKATIFSIIVS